MKLKLTLKLNKLPPKLGLKLLPWLAILVLLILFGLTLRFMKVYFYNTITQAEEIYILRSQVSLKTINIKLYQQVLDAWQNKKQVDPEPISNLPNPFSTRLSE